MGNDAEPITQESPAPPKADRVTPAQGQAPGPLRIHMAPRRRAGVRPRQLIRADAPGRACLAPSTRAGC